MDATGGAVASPVRVVYERRGAALHVVLSGVTNHELRECLVGFWATLDAADRADHVAELEHYAPMLAEPGAFPDRFLSPIARAIAEAIRGEGEGEAAGT
jgi:hypothetical protein